MWRRLGAVAFGVAVLAVAFSVRGGGSDGGSDAPTDDIYDRFDDDEASIVCVEELASFCGDALPFLDVVVRVEPVWETVDRLAGGAPLGADVWLTFRPFDVLVRGGGQTVREPPPAVLARSPLVVMGAPGALAATEAACPGADGLFGCLAGAAAADLALPDPATSALGALVAAEIAADLDPAAPPTNAPPTGAPVLGDEAASALRDLLAEARLTPIPFEDVVRAGAGVALTTEAELLRALADLSFEELEVYDDVAIRYPLDVRSAEVIAVASDGSALADDLIDVLGDEDLTFDFERSGWETPVRTPYELEFVPPFARRPTVRVDLGPPEASLVTAVRTVGRALG